MAFMCNECIGLSTDDTAQRSHSCVGKSTFLNSILGCNMLPVHNEPCTARICRIDHKHTKDDEPPVLTETCGQTVRAVAEGFSDICHYLAKLNTTARGSKGKETEPTMTITANFAALEGVAHIRSKTVLSVIDTPGKF